MCRRLYRVALVLALVVGLSLSLAPATYAGDPATASEAPQWECCPMPGLPDPCRNTLYAVTVVPGSGGSSVWAAGMSGTILRWDGSSWSKVDTPASDALYGISMPAENDGWAVGADGRLLRWNGSAWMAYPLVPGTDNYLRDVEMLSTTEGWFAGDKYGIGQFRYWDGSGWKAKASGASLNFGGTIYAISAVASDDVWAAGAPVWDGQIMHWDGSGWSRATIPEVDDLRDIDMRTANDGWAVGDSGDILRWNGAEWSAVTSPTEENLRGVSAISANDAWAVGFDGVILHWNGTVWQNFASPMWYDLYDVTMVSATDGWAVGDGGTILRYNGASWTEAIAAPDLSRLTGLSVTPGSYGADVWAVGCSRYMRHWNGTTWEMVEGAHTCHYDVSMVNANDGWVSATRGFYAHWNGSDWTGSTDGETSSIVKMLSPTDGWGFGWGDISHWDGSAWSTVTSPTTRTFYGASMYSSINGWAVGSSGTIVRWDGSSWELVDSPVTSSVIWNVAHAGPDEAWAVATHGHILHWNGSAWTDIPNSPTYNQIMAIDMISTDAGYIGWIMGNDGVILYYDGAEWTLADSPTGHMLWEVEFVSTTEAWAVGDFGVILHYGETTPPVLEPEFYLPLIRR